MGLFGKRKKSIECCYCAKMMRIHEDARMCECGKEENPPFYMQDYRIANPFYVPIVGWSSVGKTVWLHSLTRRMRELSRTIWDDFTPTPANEATMRFQREVEGWVKTNELPKMTQLGVQETFIMLLLKMPYWGSRTFVMRDCGGENFEDFVIPEDQLPFLLNTRTAYFMFSINDIAASEDKSMEQLLQGYVNSLLRHGCNIRKERRKIIVILSKADELQKEVPKHLFDYLVSDPVAQAVSTNRKSDEFGVSGMAQYVEKMTHVSDEIEDWVSSKTDGKQFINFAKTQRIDLRFTLTSSLGGQADDGRMGQEWEPFRVLDPFFWALEFHSVAKPRSMSHATAD